MQTSFRGRLGDDISVCLCPESWCDSWELFVCYHPIELVNTYSTYMNMPADPGYQWVCLLSDSHKAKAPDVSTCSFLRGQPAAEQWEKVNMAYTSLSSLQRGLPSVLSHMCTEEPAPQATAVNVNRSLQQTRLYFILLSLYCAFGLVVKNSFSTYYSL